MFKIDDLKIRIMWKPSSYKNQKPGHVPVFDRLHTNLDASNFLMQL